MDRCGRRNSAVFLLLLVIVFPDQIPLVNGNGSQAGNHKVIEDTRSSLTKTLTNTLSMLKKSRKTTWDKIKAIIHHVQLQFLPPNLDFRGTNEANAMGENGKSGSASQKMKVAAEKSFKTSQQTAEKTAESAATAVEQAAQTTAQTVKRKFSVVDDDGDAKKPHDEL